MTEMACDEPLMQLESAYVEALGQVDTFALTSEGLLLTGGTATLTFTEEPSEEALPLTGTTWTLTTIALPGSDVVGNVIAATEITAVFADDGTMTGSGGCNQLNGPYETDDGALTIGPLASTMISCGADIDEQEQAYMATIDAVFSYTIEGSQLTMQDVDGADILVFDGS
jgi:heat shock protein HslJ